MEWYIGWLMISGIVAILLAVVVWAYRERGRAANRIYFLYVFTVPVLAIVVGGFAAYYGKNIAGAYAAVLVAGGTVAQILLELSKESGKPLVGSFTTVRVRKDHTLFVGDTDPSGAKPVAVLTAGEDDVRDALRASGWSLILVGAVAGAVGAFF